jgi:hypothetical protein
MNPQIVLAIATTLVPVALEIINRHYRVKEKEVDKDVTRTEIRRVKRVTIYNPETNEKTKGYIYED